MPEPTTASTHHIDDPSLDGGEWLFQRDGQIYGPVEGRRLAELLYRGELSAASLVSSGDGRWQTAVQVPQLLMHVKRAEAAQRVEQEITGARLLRVRRSRTRTAALVMGALALVGGAGGLALQLGRGGDHSPLLDDFGAGVSIAVPARIGVAVAVAAAGAGEVEVAVPPEPSARGPGGVARSGRSQSPLGGGAVAGDDLVATHFDAGRIQQVVQRQQRTLAPCLRAEAGRTRALGGQVPLEFTIGNEGRVVRVVIQDPRMREGALRDCFERVLSGWSFDRFPGQRPSVSLVFRVGA